MRAASRMPFGAELQGGVTRFRLWAPAARSVEVDFPVEKTALAMVPEHDGWFVAHRPGLAAGTRYGFRIDGRAPVPDPASRANPEDALGPSALVDPAAFAWTDGAWRGRPWEEAAIYELHIGTFTPEGTFRGVIAALDHLVALGITAIELMPVADFQGLRGWGYDGVLPYAPDAAYGTPEDLKALIDAAHARNLMVLLDVVYNHFGPEGNFLSQYAPGFFNESHRTPWGAAINFDGAGSRHVRDFFISNALYWLEEFHFDGLRLDAVHAIADDSRPHIIPELASAIANGPGARRQVHLVLENDRNEARWLETGFAAPHPASAQWNDDFHHAAHVLVTQERSGYYRDYAKKPAVALARALAEGFSFQGERSPHRHGAARGEPSAQLPPTCFVNFLQNHDQVGNRALGERLCHIAPPAALRLATAVLILAPGIPMIFMGDEFAASTPFLYFCDFTGDLAKAVREGRRKEFAAFDAFRDPSARLAIPDPNDPVTFARSRLDWTEIDRPGHAEWLVLHSKLLALRQLAIVPHLAGPARARHTVIDQTGIAVDWILGDGTGLHLRANFSGAVCLGMPPAPGEILHRTHDAPPNSLMAPWSGVWTID